MAISFMLIACPRHVTPCILYPVGNAKCISVQALQTVLRLLAVSCACAECKLLEDVGKMCFPPSGGTLHRHCQWVALLCVLHDSNYRHEANLHLSNDFSRALSS